MIILFPIETTSRELIYKTYFCNILASRGFNCYLGKKADIYYLTNKFKNYVYIDKGYHKGASEKIYEQIKDNNGIIVSLDEEGAIDFPDNSTLLNVRYPIEMLSSMDYVFLWGQYQYNLIKENLPDDTKIFVTGHPRFELLKKRYHPLYEKEVDEIKEKHGNFILFTTNMGFGNNIRGDKFIISNYGDRFPNIKELIEFDKTKMAKVISIINKLSDESGKKIIIRPHPEEEIDSYTEAFLGRTNVETIYEGSVVPWLLASDEMIHPDCTTAIESLLLGKKPISFLNYKSKKNLITKLPLEASVIFDETSELINFLGNNNYSSEEINYDDYKFVEDVFSFLKTSMEIIADELSKLKNSKEYDPSQKISLVDYFKLQIKHLFFKLRKKDSLSFNKLKGINYNDINRIDSVCKKIEKSFKSNKLSKVTKHLFLFSKEN